MSSTLLAAWLQPESELAPKALAAVEHTARLLSGPGLAQYNVAALLARMTQQARSAVQTAAIEEALHRALARDDGLAAAHFALGELAGEQRYTALAIEQMRQAIRLQGNIPAWHYRLFQELQAAGDGAAAHSELAVFQALRHLGPAGDAGSRLLPGIGVEDLKLDGAACSASTH